MTQEEKLEKAKEMYKTANQDQKYVLESLFPELAGSEYEKTRKELIDTINLFAISKENRDKYIAWLEKQGEQKTATIDIDKMVSDYANNKERGNEEFGKPVNCMIRAYRQGLTDVIGKVVLKPVWSEEDGNLLKTTIDSLNAYAEKAHPCLKSVVKDEIDWLKSLKERIGK